MVSQIVLKLLTMLLKMRPEKMYSKVASEWKRMKSMASHDARDLDFFSASS